VKNHENIPAPKHENKSLFKILLFYYIHNVSMGAPMVMFNPDMKAFFKILEILLELYHKKINNENNNQNNNGN
jgi:hypothetical protein